MADRPPARTWALAAAALLLVVAGCDVFGVREPEGPEVLRRYGLVPAGAARVTTIEIGRPDEAPWALYLEASRKVGLDFSGQMGATGELHTTPIAGRAAGTRAHVLMVGGRVVGGWLSVDDQAPGIYALSDGP